MLDNTHWFPFCAGDTQAITPVVARCIEPNVQQFYPQHLDQLTPPHATDIRVQHKMCIMLRTPHHRVLCLAITLHGSRHNYKVTNDDATVTLIITQCRRTVDRSRRYCHVTRTPRSTATRHLRSLTWRRPGVH